MQLAEVVRSGVLGKVTVARASYCSNMATQGIGHAPESEPPADLDWDLWLGPRPARPFQATIMPYKFRWWQLYSSQMANWGVHYFDVMRWLTGEVAPESVSAHGGRFAVDDDRTIPDTTLAIFEHASGMLTEIAVFEANGQPVLGRGAEVELRGTLGTLYVTDRGVRDRPRARGTVPGSQTQAQARGRQGDRRRPRPAGRRDFLDNVKSRKRPIADIEEGHRSTTFAHLANIALATKKRLQWDARAERFINCDEANSFLHYEYRKPWTLA